MQLREADNQESIVMMNMKVFILIRGLSPLVTKILIGRVGSLPKVGSFGKMSMQEKTLLKKSLQSKCGMNSMTTSSLTIRTRDQHQETTLEVLIIRVRYQLSSWMQLKE
jgi:hypothetical protein